MKKSIVIIVVLLLAGISFGQSRGKFHEQFMEKLQKELNLNDTQYNQVKKLFDEQKKKMDFLRENSSDRASIRDEAVKLRNEVNEKLKEILTEEQYDKYLELQKDLRKNMRPRRFNRNRF